MSSRDTREVMLDWSKKGVLLLAKYLAVATFALGIILLVCAVAFVA